MTEKKIPTPPTYLNKYAKAKWKELIKFLQDNEIDHKPYMSMLEPICENYGRFREIREYITTKNEGEKANAIPIYLDGQNTQTIPLYNALKDAEKTYRELLIKTGLTPEIKLKINTNKRTNKYDNIKKEGT